MPRTPLPLAPQAPPARGAPGVVGPRDDPHERPTIPPPFDMGAFARSNGSLAEGASRVEPEVPAAIAPMPVVTIEAPPAPVIVERTIDDPHREMHDAITREDYAGAIEMAELILSLEPTSADATACLSAARAILRGRPRG